VEQLKSGESLGGLDDHCGSMTTVRLKKAPKSGGQDEQDVDNF
jgi:hypothetical protein